MGCDGIAENDHGMAEYARRMISSFGMFLKTVHCHCIFSDHDG